MSKPQIDLFNVFSINKEKSEQGVWQTVEGTDARIRIARLHNTAHNAKYQRLQEEHHTTLSLGEGASEKVKEEVADLSDELYRRSLAGTVITGTENFLYKGEIREFSEKFIEEVLLEMEDFYIWVFNHANNSALYRDRFEKDAVKNS